MTRSGTFRRLALLSLYAVTATGAGLSSARAAPRPGPLEIYRDWAVGCDNVGRCVATSLRSDAPQEGDGVVALSVERDAGPAATPRLALAFQGDEGSGFGAGGRADVLVDGVAYAQAQADRAGDPGRALVPDAAQARLLPALLRGVRLNARVNGRIVGSASLSGLAAALRYMDAQQQRAGTVTALVALGRLPAASVPTARALPIVYRLPVPDKSAPGALWQEERSRALTLSGCSAEQSPAMEARVGRLSHKEELVLVPCGSGAYNFGSVALIATGQPGRRTFALARFDSAPEWGGGNGAPPELVNAAWDAETGTLSSREKGRGLGDCGTARSYVWDGSVFRLTELTTMRECRGSWNWLTLWRARPMIEPKKR